MRVMLRVRVRVSPNPNPNPSPIPSPNPTHLPLVLLAPVGERDLELGQLGTHLGTEGGGRLGGILAHRAEGGGGVSLSLAPGDVVGEDISLYLPYISLHLPHICPISPRAWRRSRRGAG